MAWNGTSSKVTRAMLRVPPEDGTASDQVVGGVTAHQADDRYGPCEREPGDGH